MKVSTRKILITIIIVVVLLALIEGVYIVSETNQVIITQFGEPIGAAITSPGLHIKIPFIQKANYFEKRWLDWDGEANQIPTRDKNISGLIPTAAGE